MGRIWLVEDRENEHQFPLCVKTFFCEPECEEMSRMTIREFRRGVLEELSQVERWMTAGTRLTKSRHFVRTVRVLRGAPTVVKHAGGDSIDPGVVNGQVNCIVMEYCDG